MQEQKVIDVLFVGADLKFFNGIEKEMKSGYPELVVRFQRISFSEQLLAKDLFVLINEHPVDIIYLDLSSFTEQFLYFSKLVSKNDEFKKISLTGLISESDKDSQKLIKACVNSGLKLIHYKGVEYFELIYDPISLLDVNKAHTKELMIGKNIGKVEILQPLRVSYIESNFFRIETNSYLNEGEIIEVDNHPLIEIMPSKKLYVAKFTGRDLYFNRRFSYDLEFIYLDNDFFSSSNKNWLLYKELKNDPKKMFELDEHLLSEIESDMGKRQKAFKPIRNKIEAWILENSLTKTPKSLKILIIDHSLEIFKEISGRIEDFPFSLNFQTKVMFDGVQVKRATPHLIIFNFDERNNSFAELSLIIERVKSLQNYNPAVVVTNFHMDSKALALKCDYKNLIISSDEVSLEDIRNMAKLLDQKKHVSENSERVFPASLDERSLIAMKRKVSIVSASEIIIYFESSIEMPMWTVFQMKAPVNLLLTVVPFKEGESRPEGENIYRALIHGITEKERQKLRRLINTSLTPKEA